MSVVNVNLVECPWDEIVDIYENENTTKLPPGVEGVDIFGILTEGATFSRSVWETIRKQNRHFVEWDYVVSGIDVDDVGFTQLKDALVVGARLHPIPPRNVRWTEIRLRREKNDTWECDIWRIGA